MILIKNNLQKIKINSNNLKNKAQRILKSLGYEDFDLGIWVTTNNTIQKYNKQFRKKDKPTDILSFPYHENLKAGQAILAKCKEDKNLGDIIISAEFVKKDFPSSREFNNRLDVLLAHGIAHLLGYDHETAEEFAIMKKFEQKILKIIK